MHSIVDYHSVRIYLRVVVINMGIISRVLPDRMERWMCAWLMWSCSCAVGHGATTPGLVLLPRQVVYTHLADVVMVMHCCGCGCGAATRDLVLLPEQIEYARLADVVEPSCVAACGVVRPGCMLLLLAFFECNITNTVHEMTQDSTNTAMAVALAGPCRLDAPEDKAPAHALPDMSDAVEDDAWSGEAV